ncbi:MAG: trehalose-phosphatase, partial [Thermodesulfobacteriota bacterium]
MTSQALCISRSMYDAVIFDLDGVVTQTARVHARSWKKLFDEYLQRNSPDGNFQPFSLDNDYLNYVDGKPRYQGVISFLESRGISLPFGNVDDPPGFETVCGLGNKKNEFFRRQLKERGVDVFDSSLDFIFKLRSRGFKTAVVSSSKNCRLVLEAANLIQFFDFRVDGIDIEHLDLKGKPEPDAFLEATRMLAIDPGRCVLLEDALSGVQAGKKGGFGLVVGVDREDIGEELLQAGADIFVESLSELDLEDDLLHLPHGLIFFEEIRRQIQDKRVAVFLDYDGTLTPIVSRPEEAVLSQDMQRTLIDLAEKCTVAIISGRGLADVRGLVDIESIYYAGSHGFEIQGPGDLKMELEAARELLPILDEVEEDLENKLKPVSGSLVERKKFSIAVHYRNVALEDSAQVETIVDEVLSRNPKLSKGTGKKVFELKPKIDWHKGRALRWLLEKLDLDQYGVMPIFIGDDVTDEDGFNALPRKGVTLLVGDESRKTAAKYRLESVSEVQDFLYMLKVYLRNWKTWSLAYSSFEPEQEGLREALCTLGNGYFATRGAAPEAKANGVHYPGTYLAGGYNRLQSRIADRIIENEDLVNMPNWLCLSFRFPGEDWFRPEAVDILSFRQELDIKNGVLHRTIRFQDESGRETKFFQRRLVCMDHMHLAAMETGIVPVNWSGEVEIRSALDGQVANLNVKRYQALSHHHLEPDTTSQIDEHTIGLRVRTNQSHIVVAQAARTEVFEKRKPLPIERECLREPGYIAQEFRASLNQGLGLTIEKVMAMYTSRDYTISEPLLNAANRVAKAERFAALFKNHTTAWNHLWRKFAVEVELNLDESTNSRGNDFDHYHYVQRTLHLYCFHILQSASMHSMDIDVGMPARGWHGEGYRGHIFWDELIIFPYLNYRAPQITRTLLMYRYRRLNRARELAREIGCKGAMYPWQSGSTGREETQQMHLNPKSGRWIPDHSHLQRHVNVAIVYNIWQYCQISGDFEFLSFYGAEMILEIARFWASIS